jgi:hypothetical protein
MATAGKRIVLANGKFGVLSSGKWSTADADGDCVECCGTGVPCTYCAEGGGTPETLEVVISDVTFATCFEGDSSGAYFWETPFGHPLNAAFVLAQVEGNPCRWWYESEPFDTTAFSYWPLDHNCNDFWNGHWAAEKAYLTIQVDRNLAGSWSIMILYMLKQAGVGTYTGECYVTPFGGITVDPTARCDATWVATGFNGSGAGTATVGQP